MPTSGRPGVSLISLTARCSDLKERLCITMSISSASSKPLGLYVTAYMAYRKKKTVEIHHANSDKKDKYSGKFKFSLDDFTYHISEDPDGLLLTLKRKKKASGSIKEVRVIVDRNTFEPKRLRIKVAFIWTTIRISDFKSGGITDDFFVFPRSQYAKGWKFVDKRK